MNDPFFIVGCVRSGTTLLRNLLRTHPNLECPEETFFFRWGDPFASVRYNKHYNKVVLKKHRQLDGISEEEFQNLYSAVDSKRQLADKYCALYLEKRGNPNARWFDKSPQNVYGMFHISILYPGVKFVHIHRNPLNVVTSLMEGKSMRPHSIKGGINYWNEATQIINRFKSLFPNQVYELSYESLTTYPDESINDILAFLGENPLRTLLSRNKVHKEKNKYVKALSKDDIIKIKHDCNPFYSQYGYV